MEFFNRERLAELLTWPAMVDGIAEILGDPTAVSPPRHVHTVSPNTVSSNTVSAPGVNDDSNDSGDEEDVLLLMPAWITGSLIGIKAVTFFGSNTARGLPNVNAAYMVFDGETGIPIAVMDGEELGSRRTMAASALASKHLSRSDAASLLVVGTGQLAPFAVEAHCSVRPIERVQVWGRNPEKAAAVVEWFAALPVDFSIEVTEDLDAAVAEADVISCVTSAGEPLIRGELLAPGTHLDLVGSFKEDMRERPCLLTPETARCSQVILRSQFRRASSPRTRLRQTWPNSLRGRMAAGLRQQRSPCSSRPASPSKTLLLHAWPCARPDLGLS